MLCQTCQNIFRDSYPHKNSNHHLYVHQLEQAAFEACRICRVLWHAISDRAPSTAEIALEASGMQETVVNKAISQYNIRHKPTRWRDNIYNISELSFTVNKNGIDHGGKEITFCLQPRRSETTPLSGIDLTSQADSLLGTEEPSNYRDWTLSIIFARKWLQTCLESHNGCQSAQRSGLTENVPTRLLQIGQPSTEKIRLLLNPKRAGIEIQYATLSHCWGTSHVFQLTSTSLRCLQEGITISELGLTFQDAIFTAQLLGIQFIWIDSLCIFQDFREDWQREAPLMIKVYRYAILNIAASAAADNKAGCFPERKNATIKQYTVQSAWVDCLNDSYHLYHDSFWQYAFEGMPLMKRAWVVQELLLAPRILYLGGTQLFWECAELAACETYPGGIPPNVKPLQISRRALHRILNTTEFPSGAVERGSEATPKADLAQLWNNIVKNYTTNKLTYTSDKLVALSGIAKLIQRKLDDQYCAGLWKKNLVTQLLWHSVSDEQRLHLRPKPYRAPSWSWASLDGTIWPSLYDESSSTEIEILINITECEIESPTDDTTSAVKGGTLRLSGWLASMRLCPDSQNEWSIFFNGTWWKQPAVHIALDCKLSTFALHCLPLLVDIHQFPQWNVACLLLGATGDVKGQFRRFGTLRFFAGAFGMEHWTAFRRPKNEAWLEYEALSRNDQYIISII